MVSFEKYKIKSQKIEIRLCVLWASHVTLYQIPKFYAINWSGVNFSHNPNLWNVVKKQVKIKSKRILTSKNEYHSSDTLLRAPIKG